MRIIISPAKKMRVDSDDFIGTQQPALLKKTKELLAWLQHMSYEELKKLWNCSDKIAEENFDRLQNMDPEHALTPAVLSYEGIQYQYMAPSVFENQQFEYVEKNLRILSGFYGILRPMDTVTPYRLEMQTKGAPNGCDNLYEFWGDSLYRKLLDDSHIIINLASKEYAKCIEPYLTDADRYITCIFGELINGKVVQKGVYAKMARGEMVRFLAQRNSDSPEDLKEFNILNYCFDEGRSEKDKYVFLK